MTSIHIPLTMLHVQGASQVRSSFPTFSQGQSNTKRLNLTSFIARSTNDSAPRRSLDDKDRCIHKISKSLNLNERRSRLPSNTWLGEEHREKIQDAIIYASVNQNVLSRPHRSKAKNTRVIILGKDTMPENPLSEIVNIIEE